MQILFWITTLIALIYMLLKLRTANEYIYIIIGIYLPLVMYFFRWSGIISIDITKSFYYIFVVLNISIILIGFFRIKNKSGTLEYDVKNKRLVKYLNIFFVLMYLLENYIGSGTIIPTFNNIDIHTYSAPIIAYFTRNIFCIMLINLLFFIKTKEKKFLFWIIILFLIPILTRGSRMSVFIAIIRIILLFLVLYKEEKRISKMLVTKLVIAFVVILISLASFTNYRMNKNSQYQYKYSELISYNGPKIFGELLPVYYGYFPLSYDNLNINLKLIENDNINEKKSYGLYTFKGIFFSVFQLHKLANIDPNYIYNNVIYNTGAAIVPTMFYELYYDFEELVFIPILIFLLFTMSMSINRNRNILACSMYYYYVPLWILSAFQNSLASASVVWGFLIILILFKLFIRIKKN